jgi:hypothetical protein
MAGHFFDAFLGAIFGGVVTIAVTIALERLRSPRVKLDIGEVVPLPPRGPITNNWRSLRIEVSNERLPPWADWWLSRLPAQQCRAEISFLRLDGTQFFAQPMTARWEGGSPEPKVVHVQTPNGAVAPVLINPQELKTAVDIYPGAVEQLDLAIRVDQEEYAYAWNDESYYYQNWRNPSRRLNCEQYLIEVLVSSTGPKSVGRFRIDNDGPFTSFSLDELTPAQQQTITRSRRIS